jgi:hypothetical protein
LAQRRSEADYQRGAHGATAIPRVCGVDRFDAGPRRNVLVTFFMTALYPRATFLSIEVGHDDRIANPQD